MQPINKLDRNVNGTGFWDYTVGQYQWYRRWRGGYWWWSDFTQQWWRHGELKKPAVTEEDWR